MGETSHRDVILVHSSDLHLGSDSGSAPSSSDTLSVLCEVLAAARAVHADLLILAGDTFENNRLSSQLLDRAVRTMRRFDAPIVILPGNHDPLTPDSVYRRAEISATPNVCVLGLTVDDAVVFPKLELEVWGRAHLDYADMLPLRKPRSRSTRWQLATAHGHYVEEQDKPGRLLGSWLIRRKDLIATGADYVALGHWNPPARVGGQEVNAYYSGSPEDAGTVNVVRLRKDGAVEVMRAPLAPLR